MMLSAEPVLSGTPTKRSLRVLIVEDDVDSSDALAELFALEEHQVRLARDGDRALSIALTWLPDVVLMDLGLPPGLSGLDVARSIRRHGLATHLIALTRSRDGASTAIG